MVEWLNVRKHQLPIEEMFARQNKAWKELMEDCKGWVRVERVYGGHDVMTAYQVVAERGVGPEKGLVWSLWDREEKVSKARL